MADRLEMGRTDEFQSMADSIPGLGGVEIETGRGPVFAVDTPGMASMWVENRGQTYIAIMLYHPPEPGQEVGAAFISQMSAQSARTLGAALISLANQIDGGRVQ